MDIYYSKKIDMGKLKVRVKRKKDVIRFKKHCKELLKNQTLRIMKCFVCGSSKYKFIVNIFGFDYVQCLDCSHVFVSKLPDFGKIRKSYSSNIFNEMTSKLYANEEVYPYRINNIAKPKVEFIEKFVDKGNWLDIGCGAGEIIYYAKKQGWDVMGLETNKIAIDFILKHLDINVENKLVEDMPQEIIHSFDVISMFGVLEHLTRPKDVLEAIYNNSKDTFKLVVEVQNFNSFSSLCQIYFTNNVNRHFLPFAHISMFTFDSLKKLLNDTGFEIISAWFFGQDFYEFLQNLLLTFDSNLEKTGMFKFLLNCFNEFQSIIDKKQKSDSMLIIAQKNKYFKVI